MMVKTDKNPENHQLSQPGAKRLTDHGPELGTAAPADWA